jgi:hypothetical protein
MVLLCNVLIDEKSFCCVLFLPTTNSLSLSILVLQLTKRKTEGKKRKHLNLEKIKKAKENIILI